MRPGFARVRRFVDTVSDRQIGAVQSLATADVDDVRLRGRDRDGANRARRLIIKDGIPGTPEVGRLPYAAVHGSDVEDVRLAGNAGDGARATSAKRADVAPAEFGKGLRVKLLGVNTE